MFPGRVDRHEIRHHPQPGPLDRGFREPDVLRFLGVAETANVTTTCPPLRLVHHRPGEVVTTWTQSDITVSATSR
jgi:hypothetical protein